MLAGFLKDPINSLQLTLNFRLKVKVLLMLYLSKVKCLSFIIKIIIINSGTLSDAIYQIINDNFMNYFTSRNTCAQKSSRL